MHLDREDGLLGEVARSFGDDNFVFVAYDDPALFTTGGMDRLASLAKATVPLFAIHGDVDTVVQLAANSGLVKERYTLELRAEGFSVTNTPQFSNPNASVNNYTTNPATNTFGVITGAGGNRTMQFGMKFGF